MSDQISPGQFDEFKCRVLDSLEKQYALSQSTNETLNSNSTAIAVLNTQMATVLEHVKAEQRRARETKIAKLTGLFALLGTLITAAVAWFK